MLAQPTGLLLRFFRKFVLGSSKIFITVTGTGPAGEALR
jgi:hypothetical protein